MAVSPFSGTDTNRDYLPAYEYLPIHSLQPRGANRHVEYNRKLDNLAKDLKYNNARGPELCTSWELIGLRTTPQ